ncbi:cation/calcium exchanger 1-like [Dendrobium catenatum]|uniref:Cation/calcium exchanger 1 n=1 Tax=Dendrobium catenatum TaxID=906689 RepID=A0A2I0WLA1_9ASPA|nr:cation/calcium exchanger 1-like [Dendrobium catenatum]PKU76435.1 Cation/calcium exchanger 1 [Dendrobium catenatum]
MALASLCKSYHIFINLSFILVIFFFLFSSILSSSTQSISLSFILKRSSPNDCRAIEALEDSESKCSYLKINDDCGTRGYFDYLQLFYCVFGNSPLLGYIILFLWLLVLFYLLGNTASQYFCPSLEGLSRVLNISPTIAGVTLLSLGNGAPDVFSSIVSFAGGGRVGEVGLSSVLGGGFFVSSAVVGVISICIGGSSRRHVVAVDGFSFIRDLCYLLVTLSFLLLILVVGRIHILGSIFFISLYILYVIIVSTSHCCKDELGLPLLESIEVEQLQFVEEPLENKEIEAKLSFLNLKAASSWFLFLVELPLFLPRRLTIPIVTDERWSKPFAVASVTLSPILLATLWNSQTGCISSEQSITIFLFAALFGMILGFAAMEGTERSHPPKLLLPWLAGGFLMSVVWSYMVAGELVSLLVSFGHIIGVSPSVLGVTVLAWGNSLGDLIANVTMAINGGEDGAQIAISGCYAGPIFNILVGLGMSLVLSSWASYPEAFVIPEDPSQFVIIGFLIGGLLWALAILPRKGMKLDRNLGVGLLTIYSCFLCLRLLESLGVLKLAVS